MMSCMTLTVIDITVCYSLSSPLLTQHEKTFVGGTVFDGISMVYQWYDRYFKVTHVRSDEEIGNSTLI